jgi:hypothetical protein
MAPLVPTIISPEFNFVIALIVGIGFGYALEQAGFSSTRKLVGLFYGYDFTVLKVFFTAGVTAMTGVLLLGHLGLLNLDVIYVNPTFLWSAIVGGLIMGAGFIIGGFCPGTSICAAAVGRLDAMAFIGGSVIGILIFMEGFGGLESLYMAKALGALTMDEVLGISPELFGILLTVVAVVTFYFTSKLEDHINKEKTAISQDRKRLYAGVAVVPIVIILLIWVTPNREEYVWNKVQEQAGQELSFHEMDVDELAFELVHHAHEYNVIDVRDTAAFKTTIPSAINIPLQEMDDQAWRNVLKQPYKKNVFIGDTPGEVRQAAVFANLLGDDNPILFKNSVMEFREAIYDPVDPGDSAPKHERDVYRFREDARVILLRLEERLKNLRQPVKTIIKKVEGGCT